MSLVKRNEDYPMWPSIFNEFFGRNFLDFTSRNFSATNTTLPSVNIMEDQDQFTVELAAPGFDKGDFKIEHNNNVLTISSDKKVENEVKEGECFSRKEFSYQSFSRSFTIPDTIDDEKITAKYENGILKVILPKRDEAKPKPALQIEIQ
ncbi:MAG: Hsp20/alpha crystallin family protein [Bacteroidales bacterium]|nr:Hsp20/alpha crystallin family protein [Bacteroidales bacterium]